MAQIDRDRTAGRQAAVPGIAWSTEPGTLGCPPRQSPPRPLWCPGTDLPHCRYADPAGTHGWIWRSAGSLRTSGSIACRATPTGLKGYSATNGSIRTVALGSGKGLGGWERTLCHVLSAPGGSRANRRAALLSFSRLMARARPDRGARSGSGHRGGVSPGRFGIGSATRPSAAWDTRPGRLQAEPCPGSRKAAGGGAQDAGPAC
jgi:hypothetical protein